ncbi:MAG TPA: substrate-binding domain-containing protein, partial [Humisphaera sp.]|nr:substrate-binding domain-containing protein [Humisphaera sp.]
MADRPHVALIVETSIHYGRQVLQGITRYVRSHQPWSCFLEQRELWASPPAWLKGWAGSGVICRKTTPALAKMLAKAGIPVVDLSDIHPSFGVPRIESDHHAMGIVGADHLLERGFTQFAFCGFDDQAWSIRRREGFLARLAERGHACDVWESPWPERQSYPWE